MNRTLSRTLLAVGVTIAVVTTGALPAMAVTTPAAPTVVDGGACAAPTTTTTPAQQATVSASYTAPWNSIAAVTDGVAVYTGGTQTQLWGTYSSSRPAQQWLQYDWSGQGTLSGASVAFWYDNASSAAGDGVAVPKAWRLQSWTGTDWQDIVLAGGAVYPVAPGVTNTVTFASPVATSKLRAVFDATSDGSQFAAIGVSDFAVSGTVPPKPGVGLEVLSSNSFNVGVSRSTGGVYHLGNAADAPECTNYVMNPTLRSSFDVDDSRWVGDVLLRTNGTTRVTGLSDDIRTVTRADNTVTVDYSGNAANANGIRGFGLTEKYALTGDDGDVLHWSLDIANTSGQSLEIQDLGIPLLMNSWWDGGNQTGIYEQNVARHSYVADDGSYMYWQRPNGEGPYLVMVPDAGTSLEFKDKARPGEGPFAEVDPSWEGLVEYYIHSKNIASTRVGANKAAQYLPASSQTLTAGQTANYGFTFRWADDYAGIRDALYDAGVVDTVSLPGMTVPNDLSATLAVRARDGIDAVVPGGGTGSAGADAVITPKGEANGYQLFDVKFSTLGENFITVQYGGGRKSVMQYYSIEPVETLIDANAAFIAEKQQATDPARGYDGAYLQWDMRTKQIVTRQNIDSIALSSIDNFKKLWMTGGSDDSGLSPAAFLAEKNTITPDSDEIDSLDYYIDNFLLGYLQNQFVNGQRTWNLYHWYDGGDGDRPATGREDGAGDVSDGLATWRVMNSPHVWNTYFAMYRIAKDHPGLTERSAAEYLDFAYNTLKAYYLHSDAGKFLPDSSRDMASMGELSEPLIRDALGAEGRSAEAAEVTEFMRDKYEIFASKEYPFASEMSIDTTAFEANYTFAKEFGDDELARKVTAASLAARGTQPLWYFYGGDNRHMGESWWNLGYETQLGAWQQQDYILNYDETAHGFDLDETLRSTYGAYLAGWANINSGQISSDPANYGAASWQFQSEKGASEYAFIPNLNGWWSWSGESALGFWGGLKTASVNVVDDGIVGAYAYGGSLEQADGETRVVPKDGVRQRLNDLRGAGFGIELEGAKYSEATFADDHRTTEIKLENVTTASYSPTITLRGLPAGSYTVRVDGGAPVARVTSDGSANVVTTVQNLTAATNTVTIAPADASAAAAVIAFGGPQNVESGVAAASRGLEARKADGTPASGRDVTFTVTGPAAFTGSTNSATVRTNAAGVATYPALIAKSSTGAVTVTAIVDGISVALPPITVVVPSPSVKLSATSATGVKAGKVTLSVVVKNNGTSPVTISIKTKYGTKTFASVASGATVSNEFLTYLTTIPAGTVTVVGVSGEGAQQTYTSAYSGKSVS